MASSVAGASLGRSMGEVGGTGIAPEHIQRLLHAIDTDLDELISLEDIQAFVSRYQLQFDEETLRSMFSEANYTRDGLLDIEQLLKAGSGRMVRRTHNADWQRLFEEAPRPQGVGRLTELPSVPVERQPIRASFEQEREIMTFSPHVYTSSRSGTLSRVGSIVNSEYAPAAEAPAAAAAAAAAANAPASPPPRFGFATKDEFDATVRQLERTSAAFDWRGKLRASTTVHQPPPVYYYGLHPREFENPCSYARLPLREEGVSCRRGEFTCPLRWAHTEGSMTGTQVSRAVRSAPTAMDNRPSRITIADEKRRIADNQYPEHTPYREAPMRLRMNGVRPLPFHDFRVDATEEGGNAPYVSTLLGTHWPKKEPRPVSGLWDGAPSQRLAVTENMHPASRLHWLTTHRESDTVRA